MSSNATTPQPDSNDSNATVAISVIIAVVLITVICCVFFFYYKRKKSEYGRYGKTYDETEEVEMNEMIGDTTPVNDGHNQSNVITTKAFDTNVIPTTSINRFSQVNDNDDEDEGLMSDNDGKRYEIQQWFNDNVELNQDNNNKYTDLFIENGYDEISAFRYINKNQLDMMGVDNRAHQRCILEAINKQYEQ
eukprot:231740_1